MLPPPHGGRIERKFSKNKFQYVQLAGRYAEVSWLYGELVDAIFWRLSGVPKPHPLVGRILGD